MNPSITISIIAFNEADSIASVIEDSLEVLERLTPAYEILVINDGSRDNTLQRVDRLAMNHSHIRRIDHAQNEGLGETLRDALFKATMDLVFFIPGDGQINPRQIECLLPAMDSHDLVIGLRHDRQDTPGRRLFSKLYNQVISFGLSRAVQDVDSVVLVRRQALTGITLRARSPFVHAELLLECNRRGLRWTEVPIEHLPRRAGVSRVLHPTSLIRSLWEMATYFFGRSS